MHYSQRSFDQSYLLTTRSEKLSSHGIRPISAPARFRDPRPKRTHRSCVNNVRGFRPPQAYRCTYRTYAFQQNPSDQTSRTISTREYRSRPCGHGLRLFGGHDSPHSRRLDAACRAGLSDCRSPCRSPAGPGDPAALVLPQGSATWNLRLDSFAPGQVNLDSRFGQWCKRVQVGPRWEDGTVLCGCWVDLCGSYRCLALGLARSEVLER